MQFKVDESLHPDAAELLRQRGHDALTVFDQGLRGHADTEIANVCRHEKRAILTLDLDFSDVRNYPPEDYPGIVVFRLTIQSRQAVMQSLQRLVVLLDSEPLPGHLWIVDESEVRIRGGGPTSDS